MIKFLLYSVNLDVKMFQLLFFFWYTFLALPLRLFFKIFLTTLLSLLSKFLISKLICNVSHYLTDVIHYVKSVQIRSFSGPYFPVLGLNTKIYSVNTFHSVIFSQGIFLKEIKSTFQVSKNILESPLIELNPFANKMFPHGIVTINHYKSGIY